MAFISSDRLQLLEASATYLDNIGYYVPDLAYDPNDPFTAQRRLELVAPYLNVAVEAAAQHGLVTFPNRTPVEIANIDESTLAATEQVKDTVFEEAVRERRRTMSITMVEELKRNVLEEKGPLIEEAAEKEFAENDAPKLIPEIEARSALDIYEIRQAELRQALPDAARAAFKEAHSAAVEAQAEIDFDRDERAAIVKKATKEAERELDQGHRATLAAEAAEEARASVNTRAKSEELTKAMAEQRLLSLKETAANTDRVEFADLKKGDVLKIEFCGVGKSITKDKTEPTRVLRLNVRDAELGIMLVVHDSWQELGVPGSYASLPDNSVVMLRTFVPEGSGLSPEETKVTERGLTRGGRIGIKVGDHEAPGADYELDKVSIKIDGKLEHVLGRQKNRYGEYV